jgi:hypothetical protein
VVTAAIFELRDARESSDLSCNQSWIAMQMQNPERSSELVWTAEGS